MLIAVRHWYAYDYLQTLTTLTIFMINLGAMLTATSDSIDIGRVFNLKKFAIGFTPGG